MPVAVAGRHAGRVQEARDAADRHWRLAVLDLATGEETVLAETPQRRRPGRVAGRQHGAVRAAARRPSRASPTCGRSTPSGRGAAALHRAGVVPVGRALTNSGHDANGPSRSRTAARYVDTHPLGHPGRRRPTVRRRPSALPWSPRAPSGRGCLRRARTADPRRARPPWSPRRSRGGRGSARPRRR